MISINKQINFLNFLIFIVFFIHKINGHGMLMEPVGRASRWRIDSRAPKNYDDNGVYCGGYWKQWGVNGGRCGLCGDDYSLPRPRPHELGGKYGQGTIVKTYRAGNIIPVNVLITANHLGYFEFELCDSINESEGCFKKYPLKLIDGNARFPVRTSATGPYRMALKLPDGVRCNHCVLRWTYVAGNNWGMCSSGGGALGCGPQEHFRSCSDIRIN